jgi:polyhydroxyalkanoate synthesis regulator phasin
MAAMHANSVDRNAMRDALKLDERTDANTVVAQYTRACLDHRHNTWGKVLCLWSKHAMRIVDEYADEMEGEPYEVYNADGELVASGTMRSGAFHEPGIEEGHSPHKKGTKKYKAHICGAPIMDVYDGHGRCSDCKEMASAVNEDVANESVEDIIKRAMKELKRIDPQVMFRTRDMMKAVATIKQGNIAGALQDLVNGVDSLENQIQDVFNSTHDTLQRLINPKTDKEVDDEYWADVDYDKARNRVGETRSKVRMPEGDGRKKGIHPKGHPMRKKQQAAIHAGESKRKVSINQVCEAVKQTDPTYAVAMYVRTTLDPSYKTWDQVHEQVKHILSCINEGKTVNANTVMQLLSRQNLQEKADKGMMLKENIDSLRKIVRDKQYQTIKFSDGSMKVDLTTASMFIQVYEKQKPETQAKMDEMLLKKSGFLKLLDVMYSKMS